MHKNQIFPFCFKFSFCFVLAERCELKLDD